MTNKSATRAHGHEKQRDPAPSLIARAAAACINPNRLCLFREAISPTEKLNYLLIQLQACMVAAIKLSKLTNLFLTGTSPGVGVEGRVLITRTETLVFRYLLCHLWYTGPGTRPNPSPEKMVLCSHKQLTEGRWQPHTCTPVFVKLIDFHFLKMIELFHHGSVSSQV